MNPRHRTNKPGTQEKRKDVKMRQQVQELLRERGTETFRKVQETILSEQIQSSEIREAFKHFLSYKQMGFLVRPTLLSLGCEAVGGNTDIVSDVAVPLVLLSGGMDIHDDIIDGSRVQEGSITVFGKFKRDVALLTGDALLFKGLIMWHKLVEKLGIESFVSITNMLKEAFFEVGDSEALELNLVGQIDVEPEYYLQVVRKKAADIELLFRMGAILGGALQKEVEALGNYGRSLGMLWVLGDDVSDVFDSEEMTRRSNKGCLPLPVFYALKNPGLGPKLRTVFLKKPMTSRNAETILRLTTEAKGMDRARSLMKDIAHQALKQIERIKSPTKLTLLIKASLDPFLEM